VVARIRPGQRAVGRALAIRSPDTASAYADWLKTKSDIEFNEGQLKSTRELTQAQLTRSEDIVSHLRSATLAGGIAGKELRSAEADLVQSKLQGRKDVFAPNGVGARQCDKERPKRQLVKLVSRPSSFRARGKVWCSFPANVPETKISSVKVDQSCEARFYGFPGILYSAHVEELGSVLSTERRNDAGAL